MRQLCAGIIDSGNAIWSIPTHPSCTDATAAGFLAAALLARHIETATHNTGAHSCRHVVFPNLTDLKAALNAPASVQRSVAHHQGADQQQKKADAGNKNRRDDDEKKDAGAPDDGVISRLKRQAQESGDFSDLAAGAASVAASAVAAVKKQIGMEGDAILGSFTADSSKELLSEGATYARGEDHLCATAAFVFHLIPASSSASSSSSSSASHVALWAMCHVSPDTIQHAGQRVFELTCAAHVLARWAEMCLEDGAFKQICHSAPGQSPGASTRFMAADGVLGWVAAALEESKGDFGDARHASLEPNLRE